MWSLTSDPALPRDVARWSLICLLTACGTETVRDTTSAMDSVRVATFNVQELSASKLAQVDSAGVGADSQLIAAAGVIRRVRPDILLLNEVDYLDDDPLRAARLFLERYLAVGGASITYPYQYAAPTNTGILSGLDLDRNGVTADSALLGDRAYGDDSWGFGVYPGQYGMAILSRYPIDTAAVDPNSDSIMSRIGLNDPLHPDFGGQLERRALWHSLHCGCRRHATIPSRL